MTHVTAASLASENKSLKAHPPAGVVKLAHQVCKSETGLSNGDLYRAPFAADDLTACGYRHRAARRCRIRPGGDLRPSNFSRT
jgi:hypothetical protein